MVDKESLQFDVTFFNRLRGRMRNWRTDGLDCATSTKYMLNTTKTMWMMLNDAQCRWSRRFSHSGPGACRHDLVKDKLLSRQSLCHNWKSSIENVNLTIMTSLGRHISFGSLMSFRTCQDNFVSLGGLLQGKIRWRGKVLSSPPTLRWDTSEALGRTVQLTNMGWRITTDQGWLCGLLLCCEHLLGPTRSS